MRNHRDEEGLRICKQNTEIQALKNCPVANNSDVLLSEMCKHEEQRGSRKTQPLLNKPSEENFLATSCRYASQQYLCWTRVRVFLCKGSRQLLRERITF